MPQGTDRRELGDIEDRAVLSTLPDTFRVQLG